MVPNQGLNPYPQQWKCRVLTTGPHLKLSDSDVSRSWVVLSPCPERLSLLYVLTLSLGVQSSQLSYPFLGCSWELPVKSCPFSRSSSPNPLFLPPFSVSVQQSLSLGSVDREGLFPSGLFSIVDVEKDRGGISCRSDLAAAPLPSSAPPPMLVRALADLSSDLSVSFLGTLQRVTGPPASVAADVVLPASTQPCPASSVLREPFSPVSGTSASGECMHSLFLQAVGFWAHLLC